ncbi:MAG: hypothetical protein H7263_13625 [Candidatus Sericytochromatia bacterium]|nr:hypothetical protein [Candidatus Sericytochromatia bacterium]
MIAALNKDRLVPLEVYSKNIDFNLALDTLPLKNKLLILQGYLFERKNTGAIHLIRYATHWGEEAALGVVSKLNLFPRHNKINNGSMTILNKYIDYCIRNNKNFLFSNTEDLAKYISVFFNETNDKKVNIEPYKSFWNNFIEYFNDVFSPINKDLLRLKTQRSNGNLAHIKIKNSKQVKNKLITEIPLEISDEKSIFILKNKINQDIEIVTAWANSVVDDYIKQQKIGEYPTDDFFTEPMETLRTKHKMWLDGGMSNWLRNNLNKNAILNKTHVIAICCLLVINHPSITDQFLKNLTITSVIKTDIGIFLVGQKHRKGKTFSEQKILLNQTTEKLINILLINSEKMSRIVNSDYLFLHVNENAFLKIVNSNITLAKNLSTEISLTEFINKNYDFDKQSVTDFVSKVTFTKIRATCAVKEFFTSQNTKKMAEILGHENYNPKLLTHYLPEPIIHFYQSRWIRIFQKGIIYEAMKDSDYLLQAIGFKSMDTLNEFLENHILKDLPNNKKHKTEASESFNECYIAINEENLTALLSLKEAVDKAVNKIEIKDKAIFWCDFTDKLVSEIKTNKTYYSFDKLLNKASSKINSDNFKKVIYV